MNYEYFRNFADGMNNAILIAAPSSGSGKTTVARGLMAMLTRKGYRVQPMKCGPDYIDTKFHAAVTGRPSINLDTFMSSPEHVRRLFQQYAATADACIIEGMMGLFDGYDGPRGSAAEIAKLLDVPVVMVVDARSAGYSLAPLLYGFSRWDKDLRLARVIYNKVGTARHEQMLRQVSRDTGIDCLGCIPRSKDLENGERYLGLDFSSMGCADTLADIIEEHIDWASLAAVLQLEKKSTGNAVQVTAASGKCHNTVVALNSESFSFVYQETLDLMPGATHIDPETDTALPPHTELLYLPGGYPEKHLNTLTGNTSMRQSIADYARRGGRIVAECGGMMYLCQSIVTDEGEYPMCGVLPYRVSFRKADRHLSLGYRRWTIDGIEMRGHEFHYSQFTGTKPTSACQVMDARGNPVDSPIIRTGNIWASYIHLGRWPKMLIDK